MRKRENFDRRPGEAAGEKSGAFFNFLGIVLALGAALGGLLLVQERLGQEKEDLLHGSGKVAMPMQVTETEVQILEAAEKTVLTEDQLLQAVQDLESGQDVFPHEPRSGQLSMSQAIDCGRDWMEGFFMPYFGMNQTEETGSGLQEFRASCYLWSPGESAGQEGENLLHSYWTVSFQSRDITAELVLNGVSGQVLDASVDCFFPLEYQEDKDLSAFLEEYARSFGIEGGGTEADQWTQGGILCQPMGSSGIFAAVKRGSIIVCRADEPEGRIIQSTEMFNLHLYLGTGSGVDWAGPTEP